MTDQRPVLSILNAAYSYEGDVRPVWTDVTCHFYPAKLHVLSGPSGSGKSSILYLLSGLVPFLYSGSLSGEILFHGERINELRPYERCRRIGFVMQNPESQFCTFTVEEELAFGMENLCIPREEMRRRIGETLSLVGMSGYEHYDLNDLSGGQKQKIAIAAVLVMDPEVLLLDEPTANIDPKNRQEIFQLIEKLAHKDGKTVIMVEHNLDEFSDKIDCLYELGSSGIQCRMKENENLSARIREIQRQLEQGKPKEGGIPGAEQIGRGSCRAGSASVGPFAEGNDCRKEILRFEDLSFTYPAKGGVEKKEIFRGLTFSVREGELLALIGENGVGKTTLTRLVLSLLKPDSGEILLYEKPLAFYRREALFQEIGIVFQNPESQFIRNTVYEEMAFSLKRSGETEKEKEQKILAMLERFHLEGFLDKSPFVLSQGQKRRLSVAAMLLTGQKILFLDEPTYGQDYENRRELMMDMCRLVSAGITIVMITHDLQLVRTYADRVAELKNGRAERIADTADFFREGV